MGIVNLPSINQTGVNEWEDVESNDRVLRDAINGNIENANIKAGAAIAHSKLAALATGQIIAGDSGTAKALTLSGDATINASGELTVAPLGSTKLAAESVLAGKAKLLLHNEERGTSLSLTEAYQTVVTETPAAGTYFIAATAVFGGVSAPTLCGADLQVGGSTVREVQGAAIAGSGPLVGNVTLVHAATLNGSQAVALRAKRGTGDASAGASSHIAIFGLQAA